MSVEYVCNCLRYKHFPDMQEDWVGLHKILIAIFKIQIPLWSQLVQSVSKISKLFAYNF